MERIDSQFLATQKPDWQGKTAIFTRASSGIGSEIALFLSMYGVKAILVARRLDRLSELQQKIQKRNGSASIFQANLAKESERLKIYSFLHKNGSLPDILINNAGFTWYGYFKNMLWKIAKGMIGVNIEAVPPHPPFPSPYA